MSPRRVLPTLPVVGAKQTPYWPSAGDLGQVHIALFAATSHCLALFRLEETLSYLLIKPFCANEVVFSRGQVPSHNLLQGCKLAGTDYVHMYRQPYQASE